MILVRANSANRNQITKRKTVPLVGAVFRSSRTQVGGNRTRSHTGERKRVREKAAEAAFRGKAFSEEISVLDLPIAGAILLKIHFYI